MKYKFVVYGAYAIFWLVFFYLARLVFLAVNFHEASENSLKILLGTFSHGIKLDISAIAYIFAIPMLTSLPAIWINGNWFRKFLKLYTWIIIFISSVIVVGDAAVYSYWGFRLDYTPLLYLKTPQEAAASVSTLTIVIVIISVLALTVIF